MAKKDQTKTPLGRIGRADRARRYNRLITIGIIIAISSVFIVIIVGVILEGFIYPNQPIATIAGEEILAKDFQARVRFQRGQLYSQYVNILQYMEFFGSDPDIQSQYETLLRQIQYQLEPISVGSNILEIMIEDVIIKNEAQERGIEVTEDEINQYFQALFGYYPNGTPTPTNTKEVGGTSTLSATQIALVTLTPTFTKIPTFTPDPEITPTTEILESNLTPTITPEPYTYDDYQEELQTYLDDLRSNPLRVSEEDIRNIIKAQLLREKLRDAITADLPEEEEQVWVRHILVEEEETALEILDRLENGEDWAALALEFSTDTSNASKGGDLGWFNASTMVPAFSEVAFNTPIGEVSDPVNTDFGWHLIQVIGHEMHPLTSNEFLTLKENKFQDWLNQIRFTFDIEIMDYWIDRIPEEPAIPPHLLLQ